MTKETRVCTSLRKKKKMKKKKKKKKAKMKKNVKVEVEDKREEASKSCVRIATLLRSAHAVWTPPPSASGVACALPSPDARLGSRRPCLLLLRLRLFFFSLFFFFFFFFFFFYLTVLLNSRLSASFLSHYDATP